MKAVHLIYGPGGPRAFLTGLGTTFALRLSGLTEWSTIGGVSGGSMPALFTAAGLNPIEIVEKLMALDFRQLMRASESGADKMFEHAADENGILPRSKGFIARLLQRNAMHSDMLGEAIESVVKTWPENFWTLAMSETSHVLFTSVGVYEYDFDGTMRVLSSEPAPVGLAIRATCAIPGLLEPVQYKGRMLFDGSLSPFGSCPVGFVRKHFFAESDTIVKCMAVGSSSGTRERWLVNLGRRLLCHQKADKEMMAHQADINIQPFTDELHTFRFKLTEEQKRGGLLAGFNAAVNELARHAVAFQDRFELKIPAPCRDFAELLGLAQGAPSE